MEFVPGWVALHRKILESPEWRLPSDALKVFLYLIMRARHSHEPARYKNFEIKRGEIVTSLSQIAADNEHFEKGHLKQWSRQKVSRLLQMLIEEGCIVKLADTYGTHLSICNYAVYQDIKPRQPDTYGTGTEQMWNGYGMDVDTNNNGTMEPCNHVNPEELGIADATDRRHQPSADGSSGVVSSKRKLSPEECLNVEWLNGSWAFHEETVDLMECYFTRYREVFREDHPEIGEESLLNACRGFIKGFEALSNGIRKAFLSTYEIARVVNHHFHDPSWARAVARGERDWKIQGLSLGGNVSEKGITPTRLEILYDQSLTCTTCEP